jgi:putative resolvase
VPVPAQQVGLRIILVNIDANAASDAMRDLGLYGGVSVGDQKADLERQVARLPEWVVQAGRRVVRAESEVGSVARDRVCPAQEAARHG